MFKRNKKSTKQKNNKLRNIAIGGGVGLGVGLLAGKYLSGELAKDATYQFSKIRIKGNKNKYPQSIFLGGKIRDLRYKIDPKGYKRIINNVNDKFSKLNAKKRNDRKLMYKYNKESMRQLIDPIISTGTGTIGLTSGLAGGYLYNKKSNNNAQKSKRSR